MRVAVVGGGVIGLACAWYLRRGGAEVVVIERDRCGAAASAGNAGWITPVLSSPLPAPGPRQPLYLYEAKVACSPFVGAARLAGTLELAGIDERLDRRRVEAVRRAAMRYLADWRPLGPEVVWAGLRPLPPDGLPYIGPVAGRPGLYVATGHGMLGVTLAPATGAALAEAVLNDALPSQLVPFRVSR